MRTCRLEHAKLAKFRFNCNGMLLLCLCCKPSHYLLPVHKICCSSLSNVVTFSGRRLLVHKILIPNLYSGCNTFCSRCLGGYIFSPKAAAQVNSWIPPFFLWARYAHAMMSFKKFPSLLSFFILNRRYLTKEYPL